MVKSESGTLILELLVALAIFSIAIAAMLKLELRAISRHSENLRRWDANVRQFDLSLSEIADLSCSSSGINSGDRLNSCQLRSSANNLNLVFLTE